MEKIIKVGKQEVRLDNNFAWTMEYKDQFGKDILPVIMPLCASLLEGVSTIIAESGNELTMSNVAEAIEGRSMDILLPMFQADFVDLVINVMWSMAKVADESIEPPKRWIRQFDTFTVDTIIPEVFNLVLKGSFSSKNLKRLETIGESLKNLQPLQPTKSSSLDLNED